MLENCSSINISALQKTIRKNIDKDYPESSEEEIFSITNAELDKFSINNQKFKYSSMKNRLGGYRWFFLCPQCSSRVNKLWIPPRGSGLTQKYFCKNCHGLKNQSVIMGQNKIYKKVIRPLKRMKEIEAKLEAGYLRNNIVENLLNEYDQLEKKMKNCPEYRLYIFKKRRGKI